MMILMKQSLHQPHPSSSCLIHQTMMAAFQGCRGLLAFDVVYEDSARRTRILKLVMLCYWMKSALRRRKPVSRGVHPSSPCEEADPLPRLMFAR
jgi:hypothetical protein